VYLQCLWGVSGVYPVILGCASVSRPLTTSSCGGLVASGHPIEYSAQIHPRIHPRYTLDTPRYNHGYIPVSPQCHKGQKLRKLGLSCVYLQSNQLSLSGASCWLSLIFKENFDSQSHSFKIELET
jgi:hypothetical protein